MAWGTVDTLAAVGTALAGLALAWPFLRWPADAHFGVFTFWALTRRPGEPLPEQYILNNQGFTRIFLNYLMLMLFKVAGRGEFLLKARLCQAAVMALTGSGLYILCREVLHLGLGASLAGSLLFQFMSTRPQFDFMRLNAEPFYNLVLVLVLAGWLGADPGSGSGLLLAGACAFALAFAAANCKITYLGQVGLVGLALLLDRGWPWPLFWALVLGGAAGVATFVLMFRRWLTRAAAQNLAHYARWAAGFMSLDNYRHLYRAYFSRTPLAGLAVLALAGCVLGLPGRNGLTVAALTLSGLVLVIGQCRLVLYQLHALLLPWCLAAAVALDRMGQLHPAVPALALVLAAAGGWRSFRDLLRFYGRAPMREHLLVALGETYVGYYDSRVEDMATFLREHPGPFLPWGTMPQLYSLTGQRPLVGQLAFFRAGHAGCGRNQDILVRNLWAEAPPWILDPTFNNRGLDGLNSLALYRATGLAYVPVRREQSVVHYALDSRRESWAPRLEYDFYVQRSATLDLLHQELRLAGRDSGAWTKDILDLVAMLVAGRKTMCPTRDSLLAWSGEGGQDGDYPIHPLFSAALLAHLGEEEQARTLLGAWDVPDNPLPCMSPVVAAARWGLRRHLGMPAELGLDREALNAIPLCQTLDLARFLHVISLRGSLPDGEAGRIADMLASVRLDEGDYVDRETMRDLRHFMADRERMEEYAHWPVAEPMLVLRMAPMSMLAEFLAPFDGDAPQLSLVIQAGVRDQAARLYPFHEMLTIPDGPFSLGASLECVGGALRGRGFARGLVVVRDIRASNVPQIMKLAAIPEVGQWYAFTDWSQCGGQVVRLPQGGNSAR